MAGLPGRVGHDRLTGEQAALRRVATLVAHGAPPAEVLAAVAAEAGMLLGADYTTMVQYDPDSAIRIAATWSSGVPTLPVGKRIRLGGRNLPTLVFQTHQAARIDDQGEASGPIGEAVRQLGLRAAVGVPVSVEGGLWGVLIIGSRVEPLPAGTEARLAGFTDLAATAIANAQARVELRGFADEQAALRGVATLVARGAQPEEVFAAVIEEAARLLHADHASMGRYGRDGTASVVAAWSSTGAAVPVGTQWSLGEPDDLATNVLQTGRAVRIDDIGRLPGPIGEAARGFGLRAAVGVPVSAEGRLWGLMVVESRAEPLPPGTEARLAGFTELVATAIANAEARVELRGFAHEQAALRRVATLVARSAAPEEVFATVTEEAGRLLHADHASMGRYGPHGTSVVATWSSTGAAVPVGVQEELGRQDLATMVFRTGQAARIDNYAEISSPVAEFVGKFGLRAAVGVPVIVEGRLWGLVAVTSRAGPLPAGTEAQLARFTELAATAIANAEAQAALAASRARIVATADATRRRIERNLHDGAQQHLVSLALDLRAAQATTPPGAGEHVQQLDDVAAGLDGVLQELREIARGLHPAILTEGGLPPALKTLARRSALPVHLDIQIGRRLPEPVETAAYYSVTEALTNAAKHARATAADVQVTENDGVLHVRVRDDGRGGADLSHGSGLVGLNDRAEALGGHLGLRSPPGAGTTLDITLPIAGPAESGLPPGAAAPGR